MKEKHSDYFTMFYSIAALHTLLDFPSTKHMFVHLYLHSHRIMVIICDQSVFFEWDSQCTSPWHLTDYKFLQALSPPQTDQSQRRVSMNIRLLDTAPKSRHLKGVWVTVWQELHLEHADASSFTSRRWTYQDFLAFSAQIHLLLMFSGSAPLATRQQITAGSSCCGSHWCDTAT